MSSSKKRLGSAVTTELHRPAELLQVVSSELLEEQYSLQLYIDKAHRTVQKNAALIHRSIKNGARVESGGYEFDQTTRKVRVKKKTRTVN